VGFRPVENSLSNEHSSSCIRINSNKHLFFQLLHAFAVLLVYDYRQGPLCRSGPKTSMLKAWTNPGDEALAELQPSTRSETLGNGVALAFTGWAQISSAPCCSM
jgi:hypothetical protein